MFGKRNKIIVYIAVMLIAVMLFTGCDLGSSVVKPTVKPTDLSVDTLIIGYSEQFTSLNPFFIDYTTNVDMDIVNLTQVFLMDIKDLEEIKSQYSNSVATIELITKPQTPTVAPQETHLPQETQAPEGDVTPEPTPEITPSATLGPTFESTSEPTSEPTPEVTLPSRCEGKTVYRITLKDNLFTSQGKALNADDLIFNMYVMCDVSYDGQYQFGLLPINGIDEYRYGYNQAIFTKYAQIAGNIALVSPETEDLTPYEELFTKEQFDAFWQADFETATVKYMNKIIEHVSSLRENDSGSRLSGVALAMYKCGLATVNDEGILVDVCLKEYDMDKSLPGTEDFLACIKTKYGYDISGIEKMYEEIDFSQILTEEFVIRQARLDGEITEDNNKITGIRKTGAYTVEVTLDSYSDMDWLYFVFPVMPMDYYADAKLYDYDNNSFGFVKGDISSIRSNNKAPQGAGPYKYEQTRDGMIYFTKNTFYAGTDESNIKTIIFCLNNPEDIKYSNPVAGIIDGTYDICLLFENQEGYNSIAESDKLGVISTQRYKLVFSKERVDGDSMPDAISDYTTWLREIIYVKMK